MKDVQTDIQVWGDTVRFTQQSLKNHEPRDGAEGAGPKLLKKLDDNFLPKLSLRRKAENARMS